MYLYDLNLPKLLDEWGLVQQGSTRMLAVSTAAIVGTDDVKGTYGQFPENANTYTKVYGTKEDNPQNEGYFLSSLRYEDIKPENIKAEKWNRNISNSFLNFISANKDNIDGAVSMLANKHPFLEKEYIKLSYLYLIFTEFTLLDETDMIQDAAAATWATADRSVLEKMQDYFPGSFKVNQAFSKLGPSAWLYASYQRDIPVSSQGLGPLQIISGLVMEANHYSGLVKSWEPYLTSEDVSSIRNIVSTSFHPQKMFYLKALTIDLQLTELERSGYTEELKNQLYGPKESPQYNDLSSLTISLLNRACHLVQYPERTGKYSVSSSDWYEKRLALIAYLTQTNFPKGEQFSKTDCNGADLLIKFEEANQSVCLLL